MTKLNFYFEKIHNRDHGTSADFEHVVCLDPDKPRYVESLCDFLTDLNETSGKRFLEVVEEAKAGRLIDDWDWMGSAWFVYVRNDGAYLQPNFLENPVDEHVPLEQFANAVRAYLKFLTMKPPATLEVEI